MSESNPAVVQIGLGFSPCPNDTFMFHGLVSGLVSLPDIQLRPVLEDIEALNRRAVEGSGADRLAMTKLSITALARVSDRYSVLDAGAALGRGCGPLVVCRKGHPFEDLQSLVGKRVAIPGENTTANLLLRSFGPSELSAVVMRFDEVMGAVERAEVDAGLVIHEGRFTYAEHGLAMLADLGEVWEAATGLALPLGVICVRRDVPDEVLEHLEAGLRASIEFAWAEPQASAAYIREHAQEMDAEVCRKHIALYVNEFSRSLGEEGRAAIDEMFARGRAMGMVPADAPTPWR